MATYGEVTRRIKFETVSDRSVDDVNMVDIVYSAIKEVAQICAPMELISIDISDPILRWIDDVNFIRIPIKPDGTESDSIDIDDLLSEAVVYMACKRISRDHKADYDLLAKRVINNYQWSLYESVEDENDV